jgi:hypothetical protein
MKLEGQVRLAIRDALNRSSRKPFAWGGLTGYQQLQAMAQALSRLPEEAAETGYLQQLKRRVERAVQRQQRLAQDLAEAHTWLKRIAACLRYPPSHFDPTPISGAQVQQDMQRLLQQFQPNFRRCPAQAALHGSWHRLWRTVGPDLLPCYDIAGLPPDNLKLEGCFGRLRRQQRRVSGRKTTAELRYWGHCQLFLIAESQTELGHHLQQVAVATYQGQRQRLATAEAPRQFTYRLHRDPLKTMQTLLNQHAARRAALTVPAPAASLQEAEEPSATPSAAPALQPAQQAERAERPAQVDQRPFSHSPPVLRQQPKQGSGLRPPFRFSAPPSGPVFLHTN